MIRPSLPFVAALALTVTACGGDGGGGEATPPPPLPHLDVLVDGRGTVAVSVGGVETRCSESCTIELDDPSAEIVLTPTPGSQSVFQGWLGCSMSDTDEGCRPKAQQRLITALFADLEAPIGAAFAGARGEVPVGVALAPDGDAIVSLYSEAVPFEGILDHRFRVARISHVDGTARWQREWVAPSFAGFGTLAVDKDGQVYIPVESTERLASQGLPFAPGAYLLKLDGASGQDLFQVNVLDGKFASQVAIAADGDVFVCGGSHAHPTVLGRYAAADGAERWTTSADSNGFCNGMTAMPDGGVALISYLPTDGFLDHVFTAAMAVDAQGQERWRHELSMGTVVSEIHGVTSDAAGRVIVGGYEGPVTDDKIGSGYVVTLAGSDGHEVWRYDLAGHQYPMSIGTITGAIYVASTILGGNVALEQHEVNLDHDVLLAKLDPDTGLLTKARRIGSSGYNYVQSLAMGPTNEIVWMVGGYSGAWQVDRATFPLGGDLDVFVLRLSTP